MKVITPRRRTWTTVFLGAYLFIAPWLFGTSEDEASSTNAWIVGACIVVATLRVRIASGPRGAELARVGLGVWLLASPFALAFAGSSAAWNAWIVGTLILTLAVTSSLAFDLSSWMHAQKLRYQARRISPGMLLRFGERERSTCTPSSFAGTSSRVRARFAGLCSGKHLGWRSGCAS